MKAQTVRRAGRTESLGEYCVRSFSRELERSEPVSIGLYSGVPVLESGGKKKLKFHEDLAAMRGKVIT
jgi:hypothetical protein